MLDALKKQLPELGWRILPPDNWKDHGTDWTAVRETKDLPECRCNERSPQLFLKPWSIDMHGETHESVEVSIRAEGTDGIWFDLKAYSLRSLEEIEAACPQLIAAWVAAASK